MAKSEMVSAKPDPGPDVQVLARQVVDALERYRNMLNHTEKIRFAGLMSRIEALAAAVQAKG